MACLVSLLFAKYMAGSGHLIKWEGVCDVFVNRCVLPSWPYFFYIYSNSLFIIILINSKVHSQFPDNRCQMHKGGLGRQRGLLFLEQLPVGPAFRLAGWAVSEAEQNLSFFCSKLKRVNIALINCHHET